jgi:hypothetical protein
MSSSLPQGTALVEKEWGKEEILYTPHGYTVKIMTLKPDYTVSMHFHKEKKETFILQSGKLIVETINLKNGSKSTTYLTEYLDSVTLENDVPHTFYCPDGQVEDTIFLEASTEDNINDSYRFYPSGKKDSNPWRSDS